jgi:hypothetical protein
MKLLGQSQYRQQVLLQRIYGYTTEQKKLSGNVYQNFSVSINLIIEILDFHCFSL